MFPDYYHLIHLDNRPVVVSRWRKPNSDYHLRSICYYRDESGHCQEPGIFFNEHSDVMSLAETRKYLDWKSPRPVKKRRKYISRKNAKLLDDGKLSGSLNKYNTLCVYPSENFVRKVWKSRSERERALRDAIRRAMIQLFNELILPLKWVAIINDSGTNMRAKILISKKVFDAQTNQFKITKTCFPADFFRREQPTEENSNHLEKMIAKAFFDCAVEDEDFASRIDSLIEISRKYKFELPVEYYAFRCLDETGNLMTERERMWSQ